ncbi:MAG: hypothetical protein WCP56_02445 [Candidatus Saccharibacteria bacterium]
MENDQNSQMQSNANQANVPSQPIKQGGKGPIIAIVIIIIIAITGIALTWYFVNNNANKKAQEKETKINELNVKVQELNAEITKLKESQSTTNDQAATTGNDQATILSNIKALYKDRTGGGKTEAEQKYFTEAYYNTLKTGQFGADPILCAQNVVDYDKLVFNNPTITGTSATISVKTQYGTTINLKLVKQNNVWLVSSVTCPAQ